MSNEKPVELTDTERAALMHHIGGWKFERQGLANAEDAFMTEVSRIVTTHVAAARREALLEAADVYSDFEVFVAADGINSLRTHGLAPDAWIRRYSERYTEPERDEESAEGSCKPGTCGAPVMCSTDAPCPRDEEGGR